MKDIEYSFIYVGPTLSQKGFKEVKAFRTAVKSAGNCSHGPVTSIDLSFFLHKWEQSLPFLPGRVRVKARIADWKWAQAPPLIPLPKQARTALHIVCVSDAEPGSATVSPEHSENLILSAQPPKRLQGRCRKRAFPERKRKVTRDKREGAAGEDQGCGGRPYHPFQFLVLGKGPSGSTPAAVSTVRGVLQHLRKPGLGLSGFAGSLPRPAPALFTGGPTSTLCVCLFTEHHPYGELLLIHQRPDQRPGLP